MQHAQLFQNAYSHHRAGRLAEAARLYGEVLRADPKHFDALYLLGALYSQSGQLEAADKALRDALTIKPASSEALYGRAMVLHRLGRFADALTIYDTLLTRVPPSAELYNNRGAALAMLGRNEDALESFTRAAGANPRFVDAHNNRGNALLALGRYQEALTSYDRALGLNPRNADALSNRGLTLLQMRRYEESVASFTAALAIDPSRMDAYEHRGRALSELHRYAEALPDIEKALAADPNRADLLYNRANAHSILKNYDAAIRDARAALAITPDYPYARGVLVHAKLHCCAWAGLDQDIAAISRGIAAGRLDLSPFEHIALSHSAEEQRRCAELWASQISPPAPAIWRGEAYRHDKIRVAYLSADYRMHPVAAAMAGVFEAHDRERFDITAISFTPEHRSVFRDRLEAAFDRFVDVRQKSDSEVASLLRHSEIDIAVDLTGFTRECRTGILALKPAPVQVNYLGYPGTMGAPYIDYIIADRVTIPETHRAFYSEQVVRLPDSFFPYDSKHPAPAATPTRSAAGLPADGFVFCSFNSNAKVTPGVFGVWMRLLRNIEGSVLWLPTPNDTAIRNLRREAEALGVSADRLIFAPFLPDTEDHLARLQLADLFLDTSPYGAHSSACEALSVGLPVITATGSTFAGRVASSLVTAAGAPELATPSLQAYEALAQELAQNPERLAALRAKLSALRMSAPLFDTRRFTRALEKAFMTMWERAETGQQPAAFDIAGEES